MFTWRTEREKAPAGKGALTFLTVVPIMFMTTVAEFFRKSLKGLVRAALRNTGTDS